MVHNLTSELAAKASASGHSGLAGRVTALEAVGAPVFTKSFTSAEQSISNAGTGTLAHGLGEVPKLAQVVLVCKTADLSYSVGDVVVWGNNFEASSRGVGVVIGASEISYRYSSSTPFMLPNKSNGNIAAIAVANWRMIIKAWA